MDSIISELKDFQIDFQKLDIKSELENIEIKLIGCLEQCPMCGRKCDSELYDKEHQHQCKNGHQLIVMNINNQNKFPFSLYSCEELQDDYIIFDLYKPIDWKSFKEQHQTWAFSFSTDKEQKEIQQKFMYIWNEKICQIMEYFIYRQPLTFQKKRDFTQTTNYILILENQISQELSKFLIPFLKTINNNPDNKITIIQYKKSQSMCVVDQEPLNPEEQIKKIDSNGQNDKKESLVLAYDRIINNFYQFKEHLLFLYTQQDYQGEQHKEKFKSLPVEKKKLIKVIACSQGENQLSIFFLKEGYGTQSYICFQPDQISQIWRETLPIQL